MARIDNVLIPQKERELADLPLASPEQITLLVCVNDNEHSKVAVRFASANAKRLGCSVELLTIIEPSDFKPMAALNEIIEKEQREDAQELLSRFADEAFVWAGIVPALQIRAGDLVEEIIAAVEENRSIQMLYIGTAAHSPSKRSLLPSLISQLGSELLIPMMIVPGNLTEHQLTMLTGEKR